MLIRPAELDLRVGHLAARHHGVISHQQLAALGLSPRAIRTRIEHGWLRPVHRGVYAVGHSDLSRGGRWMAAVLAGDPGGAAFLSHTSAAALHGLQPRDRGTPEIVTLAARRSRPGLTVHRTLTLEGSTTTRDGIPCTTVARTLIDFAGCSNDAATRRAWSTAASLRLIRPAALRRELDRATSRAGARMIRELLDAHDGYLTQRTRSGLERDGLRFCRESNLPMPLANRLLQINGTVYEADLLWPGPRLIVEVDGGHAHQNPVGRPADNVRDTDLQLAGWRTCRLTSDDFRKRRTATAAKLRGLLAQPPLEAAPGWEATDRTALGVTLDGPSPAG